jgi:hypothetical protein
LQEAAAETGAGRALQRLENLCFMTTIVAVLLTAGSGCDFWFIKQPCALDARVH